MSATAAPAARRRALPLWRLVLWALLSAPAVLMSTQLASGEALAMDLLHPSGETAIRLMILAMLPGPLSAFFGSGKILRFWLRIRRNLGVAAFGYGLLHLVFYIVDMRLPAAMIDELIIPAIWTGWLALLLMLVPASISFDRAMRWLGRNWKRAQRLVYAAFGVSLIHWLLLGWHWLPAAIHLAPLIIAWCLRASTRLRQKGSLQ